MQKLINAIIILFLCACGSDPDYKLVTINKSVKVYSLDYHDKAENYTFKWKPPVDPNNMPVQFDLIDDMLIFSPVVKGDYQILLSITDIADEVIKEETFYYRAIAETSDVANTETATKKNINEITSVLKPKKKTQVNKNKKKSQIPQNKSNKQKSFSTKKGNIRFTIQVAAWPSLKQARIDQLKLIEEGVDAYIQRHYRTKKDEVWYRVRVGSFTNKDKAMEMKKYINTLIEEESWLDVILN